MKVTVEDVSPIQKRLSVEIPPEMVSREFDAAYNRLKRHATVKGFRKGKAPRSVLEREYGPHVNSEVLEQLIQKSLPDAIKEAGVVMLLDPQLDTASELKDKKSFTYSVLLDLAPEIDLPEYKGIKLERPVVEVADEEVDEQLEALRRHFGSIEGIEENRPVEKGDLVVIDYSAEVDGKPAEDLSQENYYVEVGAGNLNKDFEDGLIGMEKGDEKDIEVTYPEDAVNAKLAGKTVKYHVKLKDIQVRQLPELNDEFAQSIGVGFKTIEDVRERLRKQILQDKEEAAQSSLRKQLFDKLLKGADFPVPERLVEKKLDQMIDNVAGHLQERGVDLARAGLDEGRLREKMKEDALAQVKVELILDKIAEKEGIDIPQEELEQYSSYVESHYDSLHVDKRQLQSAVFDSVIPKLKAQKTVDFLLEQADIKTGKGQEAEKKEVDAS